jgi:membrane-bound lytic murein transglycosylase B
MIGRFALPDAGAWDSDTVWDRAVGPMQFIPDTWQRWGADGNGDGAAGPNNLDDAALAAGRYQIGRAHV